MLVEVRITHGGLSMNITLVTSTTDPVSGVNITDLNNRPYYVVEGDKINNLNNNLF